MLEVELFGELFGFCDNLLVMNMGLEKSEVKETWKDISIHECKSQTSA